MIERDPQNADKFFRARQKAFESRKNTIMYTAFIGVLLVFVLTHHRYGNETACLVTFLVIISYGMGYFCDRSEWDKSREEREYYDAVKLAEGESEEKSP